MDDAAKSQLYAAIRALMYLAGATGIDLAHHFGGEETQVQIAGAIVFVVAYGLSAYDKWQTTHKIAQAVNVGVAAANRTAGATPLVPPQDVPALIKIIAPTLPAYIPDATAGH